MPKHKGPKTKVPSPNGVDLLNFASVEKAAAEATKKHSRSKNTVRRYDNLLKNAREFMARYKAREKLQEDRHVARAAQDPIPEDEIVDEDAGPRNEKMDPEFPTCLEGRPRACTPQAIALFLWYKCFEGGCQVGTGEQIVSAFIKYYDELDGDSYRGLWQRLEISDQWVGNLAMSGRVHDMLKAIKNSKGEGERKHSRAMSKPDSDQLDDHIDKQCPGPECTDAASLMARAEYLEFRAIKDLGLTVWMRNCESRQLQAKHFNFSLPPKRASNGALYPLFALNLRNRKGWEKKMAKGEHQLNGHLYNIYWRPDNSAYKSVLAWKDFMEKVILKRPIEPDDYFFPTIGANLTAHMDRPLSSNAVQKMLNKMTKEAGLSGAGHYTTHCFRRGGAQYRFMYAPLGQRWSLARIRWWGGWAQNEHRDTLIKYLLDELHTYEEDHSDALCPFDETASNSHAGEDRLFKPLTQEDGARINEKLDELKASIEPFPNASQAIPPMQIWNWGYPSVSQADPSQWYYPQMVHPAFREPTNNHPDVFLVSMAPPSNTLPPPSISYAGQSTVTTVTAAMVAQPNPWLPNPAGQYTARVVNTVSATVALTSMSSLDGTLIVPRMSTSPATKHRAWEQVIEDWEHPRPSRARIPLRDWKPEWLKDRNQRVQYNIRRTIADEFINRFQRDAACFQAAYPGHANGMTPLFNEIVESRQQRGQAQIRAKTKS
ncbi:hypothetical protein BKA70DRAFT_1105034 [Coprinopsis sp. MPI-PUGE-AT-0042]|nr:hypothetical protein BKA70DRAFT_1105034 [Coprinopsis sp. MPI-PUGE-AT-0042]